ncbi:MAG TPA: PhoU domain-containing protein [Candidatus Margulisiibacteriota bacterium]|nr:PhoU domain-containing protein [Candidatus Margulisiibacteriota bacterium]
MDEISAIKKKIAEMALLALEMWRKTHQAFLEHNLDLLSVVLGKESLLNELEKEIASQLIEFNHSASEKKDKDVALIFTDVVEDLELIGDYCKDILERVQIKIEERLLFSDEAVKEYEELYRRTESTIDEIACALQKNKLTLVKEVLKGEGHIDKMVDEYRRRHNQRLLDGLCSPIACNMFLNMLDFTAAVYYHAKKIARNLLKVAKANG